MTGDERAIDTRLDEDGARWRASRAVGPSLDAVAFRALPHRSVDRRRRRWVAPVAAAAVAVAIAVGVVRTTSPGTTRTGDPSSAVRGLPTCGRAPVSSGPLATRLRVDIAGAPARARSGSTIEVSVRLSAVSGPVSTGQMDSAAETFLVLDGKIIGAYAGAVGGTGFGATVSTRGMSFPAAALALRGCARGTIDFARPDASRRPLPPGNYEIVAVVTGLGRAGRDQIVSPGRSIVVTRG